MPFRLLQLLSLEENYTYFKVQLLFFMSMGVLPAWLSVYHVHAWCPPRPEGNAGSPGTRVIGSRLPFGFWEPNLGPLQKQPLLLTTEPFLQPQCWCVLVMVVFLFYLCLVSLLIDNSFFVCLYVCFSFFLTWNVHKFSRLCTGVMQSSLQ